MVRENYPKNFIINDKIKINETYFILYGLINLPSIGHFNSLIYEPRLGNVEFDGWWLHDGLKNMGKLVKIKKLKDLNKYQPYILFYLKK